jgi:squalene-hopene/tetraprenyl-beta-curcumene cyclase
MPKNNAFKFAIFVGLVAAANSSLGQDPSPQSPSLEQVAKRGLTYLREKGQGEDGVLSPRVGSGVTSLAVTAALRHGQGLDDPLVARGLKALKGFVKPDGGIYASNRLKNYETCVAIACFSEAKKVAGDNRYDEILKNAESFVRGLQIGADGETSKEDPTFGGVGYSGKERPDLSNTSYLLEALVSLDTDADDAAIQRALVFVSRCQNLEGQWNDTKFAGLVNDGGFYYVIPTENVDPSTSERYDANGGLRSYGSMTYAGFKSLVYAGLTKNDPRAKAALEWISNNYTVEQNPGQGSAGLYYYYNTFGSALSASGLERIPTKSAGDRNWRQDLVAELAKTQQPDGSWVNANRQWFENDPNLCTAFALLALSYCDDESANQP